MFATVLLLAGCDYNEDNFPGFDDNPVKEVVVYEGDYTGKYPTEGYFTDKGKLQTAIAGVLAEMYPYCDKGSTAKINVLFGDITEGFKSADVSYTLTNDDYDSMGEDQGQPGKYNNFDSNMDVDSYLKSFCTAKYANLAEGKTVSITYKYYSGGVSNQTKTYKKTAAGWDEIELEVFMPDSSYTLQDEDYDSMGTESGQPGKYNNFDSNMDVDFYLPIFLKQKFPYTESGMTCGVTYKYYANKQTTDKTAIYKYDGAAWSPFDPYADVCEVSTKVAEMLYDGSAWTLTRLLGGSMNVAFTQEDYEVLLDWSLKNKPEYKSTKYDTEEYYLVFLHTIQTLITRTILGETIIILMASMMARAMKNFSRSWMSAWLGVSLNWFCLCISQYLIRVSAMLYHMLFMEVVVMELMLWLSCIIWKTVNMKRCPIR